MMNSNKQEEPSAHIGVVVCLSFYQSVEFPFSLLHDLQEFIRNKKSEDDNEKIDPGKVVGKVTESKIYLEPKDKELLMVNMNRQEEPSVAEEPQIAEKSKQDEMHQRLAKQVRKVNGDTEENSLFYSLIDILCGTTEYESKEVVCKIGSITGDTSGGETATKSNSNEAVVLNDQGLTTLVLKDLKIRSSLSPSERRRRWKPRQTLETPRTSRTCAKVTGSRFVGGGGREKGWHHPSSRTRAVKRTAAWE